MSSNERKQIKVSQVFPWPFVHTDLKELTLFTFHASLFSSSSISSSEHESSVSFSSLVLLLELHPLPFFSNSICFNNHLPILRASISCLVLEIDLLVTLYNNTNLQQFTNCHQFINRDVAINNRSHQTTIGTYRYLPIVIIAAIGKYQSTIGHIEQQ